MQGNEKDLIDYKIKKTTSEYDFEFIHLDPKLDQITKRFSLKVTHKMPTRDRY